jgi:hypothetical protein
MKTVQQIKDDAKRKSSANSEKLKHDLREFTDHPLLYMALIASGLLSSLAGLTIGLGLQISGGVVSVKTDLPHVFFAILYAVLFPYFFEFGLANWLHKLLHRETENPTQFFTAIFMVVVTFIGTAATAYSAMDILVTAGGFFESFTEISPTVQKWIAFALPTMFLLNIASGEIYRQFSSIAKLQRAAQMELQEGRMDADLQIRLAQMEAEKNAAVAHAEEYSRRAEKEAPQIGKQRGSSEWDKHADKMRPAPVQPARTPAMAEQGEPMPVLKEPEARPETNPTKGR